MKRFVTTMVMVLFAATLLFAQEPKTKVKVKEPKSTVPRVHEIQVDEDNILEYVKESPELYEEMLILKEREPEHYELELVRLEHEMRRWDILKESDPEEYERVKRKSELDKTSRSLSREYRKSKDDTRKAEIRTELKGILNELFVLREAEKEKKIERLEKELTKLRIMVAERKQQKDLIIEQRLKELLNETDNLRW